MGAGMLMLDASGEKWAATDLVALKPGGIARHNPLFEHAECTTSDSDLIEYKSPYGWSRTASSGR